MASKLLSNIDNVFVGVEALRIGLMVDFDGTISRIAPTPSQAVVSANAAGSLQDLVSKIALVSVVSGRSAGILKEKVGVQGISYVGNHGAEYLDTCGGSVAEGASEYGRIINRVFMAMRSKLNISGLVWDFKGYTASVHYRLTENPDQARQLLDVTFKTIPEAGGLDVFWGKKVMEIRAPIGLDKGYAVRKLVRDYSLTGAIFIGDDSTDVDGMHAITELRESIGLWGIGVAVLQEDSPDELAASSHYFLEGVDEVEAFLAWMNSRMDVSVN